MVISKTSETFFQLFRKSGFLLSRDKSFKAYFTSRRKSQMIIGFCTHHYYLRAAESRHQGAKYSNHSRAETTTNSPFPVLAQSLTQ